MKSIARAPQRAREDTEIAPVPLGRRALRGSFWSLGGQGFGQVLRLANNLILTRLLFPEAFGVMALVQVAMQGLAMFTEVGVRSAIVFHRRGEEAAFLNTAWTVQVLRGVAIALMVALLAGPLARFYEEPLLEYVLPVVGLGACLEGFASTARYTLIRRVEPSKQILFDLAAQFIALSTMCALALVWKSVWVLVIGNLVGQAAKAILSHLMIAGYTNRFAWDRETMAELMRFGAWIYLSTVLAFLMSQGDRLVMAKVFNSAELGVFTVALFLSQAVVLLMEGLSSSVLQPVYSRLLERPLEDTRRQVLRARRLLLAVTLPPVCILAVSGEWIVELLYDDRYLAAGPMLRILAVGTVGQVIAISAERAILARGDSFRWMLLQLSRALLLAAALAYGLRTGNTTTLLVGISAARLLSYLPLVGLLRPIGVWLPALDATAFALSGLVIAVGWWLVP